MAGYVARMNLDQLLRKMFSLLVCTKHPIGALEFMYRCGLYKSLRKASVDVKNWHALALDKSTWRKMIHDI